MKIIKDTHLSLCHGNFGVSRQFSTTEREREREDINKKLTCFVGAPTGPGVSDDGKEFSPFLSPAHKHPAEEEA